MNCSECEWVPYFRRPLHSVEILQAVNLALNSRLRSRRQSTYCRLPLHIHKYTLFWMTAALPMKRRSEAEKKHCTAFLWLFNYRYVLYALDKSLNTGDWSITKPVGDSGDFEMLAAVLAAERLSVVLVVKPVTVELFRRRHFLDVIRRPDLHNTTSTCKLISLSYRQQFNKITPARWKFAQALCGGSLPPSFLVGPGCVFSGLLQSVTEICSQAGKKGVVLTYVYVWET